VPTVLVATSDGLFRFADDGSAGDAEQPGRAVTALGRADDDVLAIVDAAELWRVNGSNWAHVADLDGLRATCVAGIRGDVLVGSSEARLFRIASNQGVPAIHLDTTVVAVAYKDVISRFLGETKPLRFTVYQKPGLLQRLFGNK
jgi:hypothetical protein